LKIRVYALCLPFSKSCKNVEEYMVKERTGQYVQLTLFAVARWDAQFAHRELGVQTAVRASGGGGVSLRGALEEDSKEWEAINRLSLITNFFQIKPSIFLTSTSS
jgi:hypothetical protein